jgi:hypothetical protein
MQKNDTIVSITEDNCLLYLETTNDKSNNLTRAFKNEIAQWNSYFYTNTTMAKITEIFLP